MPLRVTIEVVPNGDESRAEVIDQWVIHQVKKFDSDPEGWRVYQTDYLHPEGGTERNYVGRIAHRRRDGARQLVATMMSKVAARRVRAK